MGRAEQIGRVGADRYKRLVCTVEAFNCAALCAVLSVLARTNAAVLSVPSGRVRFVSFSYANHCTVAALRCGMLSGESAS